MARWVPGVLPALAQLAGFDSAVVKDLPSWLRVPNNATAGTVIQPAFDFLATMTRSRGAAAREACTAYAYDLRSWFEFLAMEGVAWDQIGQTEFERFVAHMACAELADDGAEDESSLVLTRNAIRRRVAALTSFYRHSLSGQLLNYANRTDVHELEVTDAEDLEKYFDDEMLPEQIKRSAEIR